MQGVFLRKYGVETTLNFQLYETDATDLKTDAAHASGDTKIMKDEGAEANTTNGFTDEGQGYSIVLTATEMQAARIVVYVVDQGTKAWLDTALVVETYGNASAMHAFDLDTAMAATDIADAVLSRGVSNVEDSADTTSLCAIVLAMLESSVSGATWTIRKTGGSTFVSKTVTTGTADDIVGVT